MKSLAHLIELPNRIMAKQVRRTNTVAEYVLDNGMTEMFEIQFDSNGDERYANSNDFTIGLAYNFPTRFRHLIEERWRKLTRNNS